MSTSPILPERGARPGPIETDLTIFDGFPYLITRTVPKLYHVILLPADQPEGWLRQVAWIQWQANRLDTCLVLEETRALYMAGADGSTTFGPAPRGGILLTGKLKPGTTFAGAELDGRRQRLEAWILSQPGREGFLLGDVAKGGRGPSPDELTRLAGVTRDGVPHGLEQCPICNEWRGQCLDPSPHGGRQVVTVHCRCANDNRCAACREQLYNRKLNANYFRLSDRRVWHVPGFSGFNHECTMFGAPGLVKQ